MLAAGHFARATGDPLAPHFQGAHGAAVVLAPRPTSVRLLALGEDATAITPTALAAAYRRLGLRTGRVALAPILAGMEDAVEYGTAQRARVAGCKVAGKTGSVISSDGAHLA